MPDLHLESIHAFWDSYDRRTLYRILVALEQVESWTLDSDPEIEPAILELGRALDLAQDFDATGHEDAFIRVLANTKAGRAMRILQSLDFAKPGFASQLLMKAEEIAESKGHDSVEYAKLFLQRNLVFERMQLLSRIFAPSRISLVIDALESISD